MGFVQAMMQVYTHRGMSEETYLQQSAVTTSYNYRVCRRIDVAQEGANLAFVLTLKTKEAVSQACKAGYRQSMQGNLDDGHVHSCQVQQRSSVLEKLNLGLPKGQRALADKAGSCSML